MLSWVWELVFPAKCIGCAVRGTALCAPCRRELPYLPDGVCQRCAAQRGPRGVCRGCRRLSPALTTVRAAFAYEGAARTAVLTLKFKSGRYLVPLMGEFLHAELARQPLQADVIVPVPLAPRRHKTRGFNQAQLLAHEIAAALEGQVIADALIRRERPAQQTLGAADRLVNLRDAFTCTRPAAIYNQRIVLVDDVVTTGATLSACADTLAKAGTDASPRWRSPATYSCMLFASEHPLVRHKVALMRDVDTEPKKFRELVRELSMLLCYEATRDLDLVTEEVTTPMGVATGQRLRTKIGLIPILRAGLGMVEGFLEMIPTAQVWHIGLYRDERTLHPVEYYNRLPTPNRVQLSIVLDPMLATGGTAEASVDILKRWGCERIKYIGLLAAPEGIARLSQAHPDVPIHVAAVDERLNDIGYIVPGLGDAGDRQFGTA